MSRGKHRRKWLLLGVLAAPVAAWVFYKPARLLTPALAGVTCFRDDVCVEDASRHAEAAALYTEALAFINASIGRIKHRPRVVFCSTVACCRRFGLEKPSAHTFPFGIVVSPRAWQRHYVRHEMIHWLQRERLGVVKLGPVRRWRSPDWFVEGMAYALSEDPRPALAAPYEGYRKKFEAWYRSVGKERLWSAARDL